MASLEEREESVFEESTVESAVSKVKSSVSDDLNLRVVLVRGGGEGVTAINAVVSGGGGTRGEARMARGEVDLRLAFFDTGDKEAGGDWVSRFAGEAFSLRETFGAACFFVPGMDP